MNPPQWRDYSENDTILFTSSNEKRSKRGDTLLQEPFDSPSMTPSTTYPSSTYPSFYTNTTELPQNMGTIQSIQSNISQTQNTLLTQYTGLTKNVKDYSVAKDNLHKNKEKYHYDDKQDPHVIVFPQDSKDIHTAVQNDINELKYYQYSIYMSSILAGATFFVAVLMLSRK
jgi:hypothetical protein